MMDPARFALSQVTNETLHEELTSYLKARLDAHDSML
jgi:hypothetical protein